MVLTEMFVSALVSLLVQNLATRASSFIPNGGLDDKRKEWTKILSRIEAVLEDAEDRQLRETSVNQWLHDVQNLVYEIDDFLDDFATDTRRHQQMMDEEAPESSRSRPSKLPKFVSGLFSSITSTSISFNPAANLRITEITSSLHELEKTKNNLGLREYVNVGGISERTGEVRLPTTSLVGPGLVYGREEDSAAMLTWLFEDRTRDDDDGNVCIISIVGMGGIGKTTLAQSLYNNERVKGYFSDRAWVCVPEDFDPLKISKIIYDDVCNTSCTFNDLNKVQVNLMEKLSKKKFLLVLDDVWNEDYAKWDLLCAPFRVGAPGSTIIVTTRSHDVAKTMGSKKVYDLKVLSDGDCLSLLAQHALQRPNFDGHPEFKEVGKVIAKRCNGLPLAAKSLGGLLRTKRNPNQWMEVSTSKIWELRTNGIIAALRLSYHHLPPYLKPLFVYCSLFPKGYEFDKHELIMLWMAQGFLKQLVEQKDMEELGYEYFSELLSRSFFQPSSGDETRFVMHDLNNDLAQFVAGLTCIRLDDKVASNEHYNVPEEARHASFIPHIYDDLKKFKAFNASRCLRTILPLRENSFYHTSYLSSLVLEDFPRLPCLRTLSFKGYSMNKLPKSIGDLSHLRYLDFSGTDITELPETVCDLYNLQTLLVHGCQKLVRLPSSIERLINLRHLDIAKTASLKEIPLGIGMLTHLRTLSKFIVDKCDGRKITELKGLHNLRGTLSIIGIENVMNVQDAMEANLLRKEGLHRLKKKWCSVFGTGTREEGLEFEVLNALKPQTRLNSLGIEYYGGRKFPGWVGDCSFCDMVKIRLKGCKNCAHLPPLGHLSSLKELAIEGMDKVKVVGLEFFGTGSTHIVAFESLISLSFTNMDSWEEWSVDSIIRDGNFKGAFSCLNKLQMFGCMKLKKVSLPYIPSLGLLIINGCSEAVVRSMVGLGPIKKLELQNISGMSNLDEGVIRCLGLVESLTVGGCEELRYLWKEEVACQVLEKLKLLSVSKCKQVESLGDEDQLLPHNLETLDLFECDKLEKMPNWKNNLTSLRRLTMRDCKKLQHNLPSTTNLDHGDYEFSNLKSINIFSCPSLRWLPIGKKLPTTLRDLSVGHCKNMEMPKEEREMGMCLSSLESIRFRRWSKWLPEGLTRLTRLELWSCWGIESIPEGSLPHTLISLEIWNCKNLKNMSCASEMQSLTSLLHLTISGCKNLEGYPSGGGRCWPPNLEWLKMGEVKKPMKEWGLATLPTSLLKLVFDGEFPEVVTFSEVWTQLTTTSATSLTRLYFNRLKNLECIGEGLGSLSSLQHLYIWNCPKLRELPETLLPTLSSLSITECPVLEERCKKEKRDYWPKISHIPSLHIDGEFIWGSFNGSDTDEVALFV